ncbi:hypothetical protein [Budvicia diplopodorum]|uniref:hypothetical protein n=1 Tax=Budvicia diplopodorum TaxID=1119056 RepID=UPI001358ABCB|nr:hypothetical protein [Budvicia diplopodorum]
MLDNPVAGKVLIATLNSWRYLSALSVLGMLFALSLLIDSHCWVLLLSLSLFVAMVCQYFYWRLWLDCRLFQIFYQFLEQNDDFDAAINMLWNKNGDNIHDNNRSLISRWAGARRLLHLGGVALLIQWLAVLLCIATRGI